MTADDLACSPEALQGADLWVEAEVHSRFFFSEGLAQALITAGLAPHFDLHPARVVSADQPVDMADRGNGEQPPEKPNKNKILKRFWV